jgi:hypothetical protein
MVSVGKSRSLRKVVGLYFATLSFYSLYWWYETNRELRDLGEARDAPELHNTPALSMLAYFLGGCLVVPLAWTATTTSQRIRSAQRLVGTPRMISVAIAAAVFVASAVVGLLTPGAVGLAFAGGLAAASILDVAGIAYMQASMNEVWAACHSPAEPPSPPEALSAPAQGVEPHTQGA